MKTKKTAGSSIEHYLFPYLGPNDICSGSVIDGTPSLNGIKKRKGHIGWQWIANNKPQEWNDFFSFAVVRNPWDTVVSAWHWLRAYGMIQDMSELGPPSFTDWAMSPAPVAFDPWALFADDNGPTVHRVLRYEHLHQDISTIPIPYAGELLVTFKKQTKARDHYRSYYNDQSRARIGELFSKVIDYFGYNF